MGINLHLVDQRSPRIFPMAFPETDRANKILRIERPQMQPPLRRPSGGRRDSRWALFSLVGPADTMAFVVSSILSQYHSAGSTLNVIRVEAHGRQPGDFRPANAVQFGQRMDATDVGCFHQLATRWSHPYSGSPVSLATPIDQVFPRIEFHSCEIVHGCDAMLQALANAAVAYVFASSAAQDVDLRPGRNPFAMEPPVFRFDPQGSGAQRI